MRLSWARARAHEGHSVVAASGGLCGAKAHMALGLSLSCHSWSLCIGPDRSVLRLTDSCTYRTREERRRGQERGSARRKGNTWRGSRVLATAPIPGLSASTHSVARPAVFPTGALEADAAQDGCCGDSVVATSDRSGRLSNV
ncbi:hypothetical protein BD309DRAFT_152798 [Dichomitus squalens]|uniref:Uncharacterized protein n=1 Tax=Dichomitus squalens TaxID=114155 RepID=A0A4Q9PQM6_9APHY|nr:hypothetical protein BD311DRAFT_364376 [Dichomitus squalens]TBU42794.1 hypothetical protein BD309DRAFT_152798 [Dichomitus squalens]TBU56652.1 hypothetical protein BD310DRAFT_605384 [Dichomitus squalens]